MPSWRRLVFSVEEPLRERVVICLHERGTLGVEEREGRLYAYFPGDTDVAALVRSLAGELADAAPHLSLESEELVPDGRWHERWAEGLTPFPIGRSFHVVPGTAASPAPPGRRLLRLPPGRAFGTGDHATTRMCLELLEDETRAGQGVLDVGTGSGILAIAARLLGADPVVAIDIDPEAVEVARRNAGLNDAAGILFAAGGAQTLLAPAFDLVVANLSGAVLLRTIGSLGALAGRRLVLSGILREEESDLTTAARREGMRVVRQSRDGDWTALLLAGPGCD